MAFLMRGQGAWGVLLTVMKRVWMRSVVTPSIRKRALARGSSAGSTCPALK